MPAVVAAHDVSLVLAGDPAGDGFLANADELRRLADADAALHGRCFFTGYIPDEDLVPLYNGAHALVMPSLAEGFGLPAIEAMACGVPVVSSNAGSLPEVVGDAGLFFDPGSPRDIAAQLTRILSDAALRDALAARAVRRASLFTWDRAAELALESLAHAAR